MSHQPFETWLFSDEPLDSEQKVVLETHLNNCDQCSRTAAALDQVLERITTSAPPEPTPGFTHRWYEHLSEYRQKRQERRIWLIVFGLFVLAILILFGLFFINLNHFNWSYGLGQFIANVSLAANRGRKVFHTTRSLTRAFPVLIPIMVVFSLGYLSAVFTLIITWFSSIIRLYQPVEESV